MMNHIPETAPRKGGRCHMFVDTVKWTCDCTTFSSRHICIHVLAVAQKGDNIDTCVDAIARRRATPNLMSMYQERIPKSACQKEVKCSIIFEHACILCGYLYTNAHQFSHDWYS